MTSTRDDFLQHAQRVRTLSNRHFNEASTRVYLIDPVLALLGYFGPDEIGLEVPLPATKEFIDYELYSDGKALAIVEAKAMDQAITDQAAAQCARYAFILGVRWCLISNGVSWVIYDAYCRGELREKHVATVHLDVEGGAIDEAWDVLSLFSRESLGQANPLTHLLIRRVVDDELNRPDSAAVTALSKAVKDRFQERVSARAVMDAVSRRMMASSAAEPREEPLGGVIEPIPESSPGTTMSTQRTRGRATSGRPFGLAELIHQGLLPANAELEARHKGGQLSARLQGDRIEVAGASYPNLSSAASGAIGGSSVNGWMFWSYKGQRLSQLRELADKA